MSRKRRSRSSHEHQEGVGLHPLCAPQESLDALHYVVAEVLIAEITRSAASKRGLSTRLISAATAFLKLNGVTTPEASAQKLDELVALMPEFESLQLPEEQSTAS